MPIDIKLYIIDKNINDLNYVDDLIKDFND